MIERQIPSATMLVLTQVSLDHPLWLKPRQDSSYTNATAELQKSFVIFAETSRA